MSDTLNIFEEAVKNPRALEQKLLGPDYPYYKYIRTPAEMGMSDDGNMGALSNDVAGMINYVQLLVSGQGPASSTGRPLGDKFFIQTGGKCKDKKTGDLVDRSMYINNVPDGSIPLVSSLTGATFSEFKGLIPGLLEAIDDLNPFSILKGFMEGAEPECQQVTLPVINASNETSTQSGYIPTSELASMSPCDFPSGVNPITNDPCRETFVQRKKRHGRLNQHHILLREGKKIFKITTIVSILLFLMVYIKQCK